MEYKVSYKDARVNADIGTDEACKLLSKMLNRPPLSRSTLWGYETGKVHPPIDVVQAMSELYQVPLDMLRI